MKKNHVFLVLFSMLLVLMLASCNNNPDVQPVSIVVNNTSVQEEYDPDDFDLSSISIIVTYSDDTTSQISLTEEMLSSADLELLSTPGDKELQVQYLGLSTTLNISFAYSELKTRLLFLYNMATVTDDVPDTYEEWLESIQGEDGLSITNATLNPSGHLIFTFSDATTKDVGQVVGKDGKEVELRSTSTSLEWKYEEELVWQELLPLSQITGIGISLVEINDEGELVITYTDNQTTNLGVILAYKVKFMDHNDQLIDILWVNHGEDAVAPTPPVFLGYTFSEWSGVFTNVTSDLTINAIYTQDVYNVEFVSDSLDEYDAIPDVVYGDTLDLPVPTKQDHIFVGWFTDLGDPNSQFFSTTPVTKNLILYAKYEKQTFTVQFVDYDDTLLSEQIIPYLESAVPPMLVERTGYQFTGWDHEYLEISSDIVIKAVYSQLEYNITFQSNGGSEVAAINNLTYNEVLNLPTPIYQDYDFLGWYAFGELVQTGDTMPAKDLYLTAKWEPHEYLLSFDSNSGSVIENQYYYFDDDVTTLPTPIKTGYTFIGWEFDGEILTAPFTWDVHTDINLVAIWEGSTDNVMYRLNDGFAEVIGVDGPTTTLVIPDNIFDIPVTLITEDAFLDNDTLVNITVGSNVLSVSDNAFMNCTSLESIEFTKNTTSFGTSVFEGASSLISMTISSELSNALKYYFGDLVANIPSSLEIVRYAVGSTTIDSTLYSNDMNGVTLGLATDMTTIAQNQFKDTQYLLSIELPNGLIRIDDSAFENCALVAVEIPNTVTSIGRQAFKNCTDMLTLDFEDTSTLSLIEYEAFKLAGLTGTITIPASVTSIESQGLAYLYNLEHVIFEAGSQVTFISNHMFASNNNMISVTLPDQLTDIGLYSFSANSSLETVIIPDSVTWVGNNAFYQCTSLVIYAEHSSEPETWDAFYNPNNRPIYWSFEDFAEDANFEYILQTNGNAIVVGRKSGSTVADLVIPSTIGSHTVTEIMNKAFEADTLITSVHIPNTLKIIGEFAFSENTNLTTVTFEAGSTLEHIQMYAFYNNESLTTFVFPDQLKTIGTLAFRLSALTTVEIPNTVTSIGNSAFAYNYDISSFTFEAGSTLTTLGSRVFYNTHFTTIDLPDSLESIGDDNFAYNTYLTHITIPLSVTTMGDDIFKGCTSLTTINAEVASQPATWSSIWNSDGHTVVWGYTE